MPCRQNASNSTEEVPLEACPLYASSGTEIVQLEACRRYASSGTEEAVLVRMPQVVPQKY